jgi:hypothetical protein
MTARKPFDFAVDFAVRPLGTPPEKSGGRYYCTSATVCTTSRLSHFSGHAPRSPDQDFYDFSLLTLKGKPDSEKSASPQGLLGNDDNLICACGHRASHHYQGGYCVVARCRCLHWRRPRSDGGIEKALNATSPASSPAKTMRSQVRTSLDFPARCEMACDHSYDQTAPLVPLTRERNRTSAPTPLPSQHEVTSPLTCYFVASEDVRQPNWQPRDQRTARTRLCTTYPDQHIRPTWSSTWSSTGPIVGASSLVRVDKGRLSLERSAWSSRLTTKIPRHVTGLSTSPDLRVLAPEQAAPSALLTALAPKRECWSGFVPRPAPSASTTTTRKEDPPCSCRAKLANAAVSTNAATPQRRMPSAAKRMPGPSVPRRCESTDARFATVFTPATPTRIAGSSPEVDLMPRSRSSLGGGRAKSHRRGRVTPPPGTLRESAAAARKATWWEARLAAIDVPSQKPPRKETQS